MKASPELLEALNQAIARELQVSIQYMWQHVLWRGVKGFAVKDELKKIAVAEMKHAEAIAERLNYLGGTPTTAPAPIFVGADLKEMIVQDQKDERGAMELYRKIIDRAKQDGDETTLHLFHGILEAEEEHDDFFTSLLEEI